ncbi:hypothetical protein ACFSTH_14110 [Paenibacillus yanchengensis]
MFIEIGKAFVEYVTQLRMTKARNLLVDPQMHVKLKGAFFII